MSGVTLTKRHNRHYHQIAVAFDRLRYLTSRQAAERPGVTVNAIKAWIREQRLPALRTPGGHHRIAEADLAAFQLRLLTSGSEGPATAPRILIADDDKALAQTLRDLPLAALPIAMEEFRAGVMALLAAKR
jgi:excisionase family DNA binding protein